MSEYCVVVADGAKARFLTLEPAQVPEVESSPRLVERGDLVNPEKELPDRELYSDPKAGRNRSPLGGPAHGYDDHRAHHNDEYERRFAKQVASRAVQCAQEHNTRYVVIAAQPRMLGFLRKEIDILLKNGMEVREVAKDVTWQTPTKIHEILAREEAIPPSRPPRA
ncbi:MAG: host attachment protein [Gammaproteobacteria bacterium]|nr:MAG: host attachment protein [Gammaproteobacteria bacterium]